MTRDARGVGDEAIDRLVAEGRRRTILVTGFGAFPGAPRNPTEAIVVALRRHRPRLDRLGVRLRVAILPVCFADIDGALRHLVAIHQPDVILHLGVASRRRISIETRAVNRAGPLHPDASGRRAGQILIAGAPPILRATYPAARILAILRRHELMAERSIDAGDYVCNATLYRALLADMAAEVGFIHVPRARTSAQPTSRIRHPRPSIATLTRAILLAILVLAPCRASFNRE